MTRKKIMFFIYELGGGGAARTMLNIINNMDRGKFDPVLVTLDYAGGYEAHLDPDVKFLKLGTKRLRHAVVQLAKVIRSERPEIVFSTIPNYNIVAILATMLSGTGARNVVREAAFLGGSSRENLKLKAAGALYRRASKVIALSDGVRDNIIARYGVPDRKINVIYNPVDIAGIRRAASRDDVFPGLFNNDQSVIVTAGRLHPDKDHATLLRAFCKVKETEPRAILVVLGAGGQEAPLKALALELGVHDSVHFLGFQPNPYAYFARADLFVLSSKKEGFGHVLAEALASGVPVVSTKAHPGACEVLEDGRYGEMCPTGDPAALAAAMRTVLEMGEAERQGRIQQGRARAGDFRADAIVSQYEEMFLDAARQ